MVKLTENVPSDILSEQLRAKKVPLAIKIRHPQYDSRNASPPVELEKKDSNRKIN